jgi:hypothetical protein
VWVPTAPDENETWTIRGEFDGTSASISVSAPAPAPAPAPASAPAPGPDPGSGSGTILAGSSHFPTDSFGRPDRTLPADRISRPALARWGIGWRPPPEQAPWTWQSLALENRGDAPIDVVVRASVVDAGGAPIHGFRSRVRSQEGLHAVSVVVRVPAGGTAVAALPVYADLAAVEDGTYVRRLEILPLGAERAIHVVERPLVVGSGGTVAPAAFAMALAVSAAGFGWLATRGGARIRALPTADLLTIALVGALTFVVGAAFQLLGFGIAVLLGPFAPLVSGIFDDAFRACLLGALVTAIPRPGVVAAATIVGVIMRAVALGSVHPVDLLFAGTAVALHEAALWAVGVTRSPAWRDEPALRQWARLAAGFGLANAAAVGLGLASTAVLYRLYFAGWYVAFLVLVPGLLYVAAGAVLAVPFARSLRRVAP